MYTMITRFSRLIYKTISLQLLNRIVIYGNMVPNALMSMVAHFLKKTIYLSLFFICFFFIICQPIIYNTIFHNYSVGHWKNLTTICARCFSLPYVFINVIQI